MEYGAAAMRIVFPVLLALLTSSVWASETELGAELPSGSRKVAERRYRSSADFEGTMKFYRTAYPAKDFPRKSIINQRGIKALHIANDSGRGGWEGLNIYEANDEVRIYVVPRQRSDKKKTTK